MHRIVFVGLTGILLGAVGMSKDATADFRKFFLGHNPRLIKAFEKKDIGYFETMATDDFIDKEGGKAARKKQALVELKQTFDTAKTINYRIELLSARATKDQAVANVHQVMSLELWPRKHKREGTKMVMEMWTKETWVNTKAGWKIRIVEDNKPMRLTVTGKSADLSR